ILSRLLDVLSRGEEADRFVVSARKNVFEAGEAPTLYAEIFNERMQPVTSAPVRLEITRIDDDGAETPLDLVSMSRENTQSTRFRRVLSPLPPGRYLVRGQADLGERSITSKPVEIRVSNTSVEFQRVHQDRAALVSLALRSGGMYAGARVDAIIDRLPLDARSVSVVRETTLRTSVWLFLLILSLLSAEWLIRKRAGMI
nr:hypothetical protein [Candidatus Krumholzibacteriota bacterium]